MRFFNRLMHLYIDYVLDYVCLDAPYFISSNVADPGLGFFLLCVPQVRKVVISGCVAARFLPGCE
jgi:hypothetical protein